MDCVREGGATENCYSILLWQQTVQTPNTALLPNKMAHPKRGLLGSAVFLWEAE